jgi:hypothetical protein
MGTQNYLVTCFHKIELAISVTAIRQKSGPQLRNAAGSITSGLGRAIGNITTWTKPQAIYLGCCYPKGKESNKHEHLNKNLPKGRLQRISVLVSL